MGNLSGFLDFIILWRFVALIGEARAICGVDASFLCAESPSFLPSLILCII